MAQRLLELENVLARGRERERMVDPLIRTLLDVREAARERGEYAVADDIRERLLAMGIDVSDSPAGASARVRPEKDAL